MGVQLHPDEKQGNMNIFEYIDLRPNNLRWGELKLGIFMQPMYDIPDVMEDDHETVPVAMMIEIGFLIVTLTIII